MSLRSKDGKNIFSVDDSEMKTGRPGAAYEDTRFISKHGEQFLAGLLDGLTDGVPDLRLLCSLLIQPISGSDGWSLMLSSLHLCI